MDINFRAWVKPIQIFENRFCGDMIEVSVVNFKKKCVSDYEETVYEFREIILMQSTGLKDMNGKEIYEGDIIVNHVGDVWVITYFRGAFRYYPIEIFSKEKEGLFEKDNIGNFNTEAFGVLGNVYENYELLEGLAE